MNDSDEPAVLREEIRQLGPPPRHGDWIQTFTGRRFWPLDPRPEEVDLRDIAQALSQQCRFTGHTTSFYSVAQHCIHVSERVEHLTRDRGLALWGLLHDASEAYLVDVARPVKRMDEMAPYREAETRITAAICSRFGLPLEEPPAVKHADRELLSTEARDLLGPKHPAWEWRAKPLPEVIEPWEPMRARLRFIDRFATLATEEQWKAAHG